MRAWPLFSVASLAVAIGCGTEEGEDVRDSAELFERGEYDVGFRELELSYRPAGADADRVLPVRVWYPARAESGAGPAAYSVGGIVDVPAGDTLDAPPIASEGPFPVLVYSHGSGGDGLLAYPYAELFASYGWFAIAPNHIGNTALDDLSMAADVFGRIVVNRPADITASLDWLETGLAGDDLDGAADTQRVLMFGHSFGGYTTFVNGGAKLDFEAVSANCVDEACDVFAEPAVEEAIRGGGADPRIDAIVPQAPGLVPELAAGELGGLQLPTMLMSARLDVTTTHEEQAGPAWTAMAGDDHIWVEMPTGGHLSFITICDDLEPELLDIFISNAAEDGCGPEFVPVSEAVPTLAAYMLAFGRQHVLDVEGWDPVIRGEPLHAAFETSTKP